MIECSECDEGQIQKIQTFYGCKEVCDACGYVAKDVDTYAGVMIWSHKTAPEIEIHSSKKSAEALLKSSRTRGVVQDQISVKRHAPAQMGGRRQNNGKVEVEKKRTYSRAPSPRNAQEKSSQQKRKAVSVPSCLSKHVQPISFSTRPPGATTYTQFTKSDIDTVVNALPSTSSIQDVCSALKLRSSKTKKPKGIISWIAAFSHKKTPDKVTIFEKDQKLYIEKEHSLNSNHDSPRLDGSWLDSETTSALGYKTATNRYYR
jgi:hypothetical protein